MGLWQKLKNLFSSPKSVSAPASTTSSPPPPVVGWKPEWAAYLRGFFTENLAVFAKAADITTIRPDFFTLTKEQQVECLVTFIRGIVYFECGFNPASASKDVGTPDDKDTWSVGLMQMSVVDQESYNLHFGYTFQDLKDPIKNLHLAMEILKKQVLRKGRLILRKGIDSGVYWATIYIGGKYDSSKTIIAGVRALKFDKLPAPQDPILPRGMVWDAELMRRELARIWLKYLGERETNGKNSSPLIDKINSTIPGGYFRAPYCISGLLFCVKELCALYNLKNPVHMTASTQEFYDKAPAQFKIPIGSFAQMGDIGIEVQRLNSSQGHAYGHLEDEVEGEPKKTLEFNTDPSGGRDGDGVYKRTRTQNGDLAKRYRGSVDVVAWILSVN